MCCPYFESTADLEDQTRHGRQHRMARHWAQCAAGDRQILPQVDVAWTCQMIVERQGAGSPGTMQITMPASAAGRTSNETDS